MTVFPLMKRDPTPPPPLYHPQFSDPKKKLNQYNYILVISIEIDLKYLYSVTESCACFAVLKSLNNNNIHKSAYLNPIISLNSSVFCTCMTFTPLIGGRIFKRSPYALTVLSERFTPNDKCKLRKFYLS